MKCPECQEQEKKSTVSIHGTEVTCMGFWPYYDEEGKYHSHDPNNHATGYSCSNGHKFSMIWIPKCASCDYGSGSKKIIKGR